MRQSSKDEARRREGEEASRQEGERAGRIGENGPHPNPSTNLGRGAFVSAAYAPFPRFWGIGAFNHQAQLSFLAALPPCRLAALPPCRLAVLPPLLRSADG